MKEKSASRPAGMTLVDWAYQEVKERILNNQFPPGFQALEQEIAAELGVSRTPLRESLKRLEAEGLLQVVPRRGIRIAPLSADDMREIYEVLTSLEATAAELLARRKPEAKELAPMEKALEAMERALEADDLESWANADETFHKSLLNACGNKRIASLANTMRDQSHRARLISLKLRPIPRQSNEEHRKLFDAISSGNWREARKVHEKHRTRTSEVITDILQKFSTPGF